MPDVHPSPAVIVGVDGSAAASSAAVWAVDEAASRNLPLKLVYVIHQGGAETDPAADTLARDALAGARRAVEAAAGTRAVRVETEVLRGNPLATLIELSRSAAMLSVGAMGLAHTCHRAGSTAAALAGSARCPVAVIHPPAPDRQEISRHADCIVAEVDAAPENMAVLGWAMAEAGLRGAPLRVITALPPELIAHRIAHWTQRYPQVRVESVSMVDDAARYLVEHARSIGLFVSSVRDRRSLALTGDADSCSVLTVGGGRSW